MATKGGKGGGGAATGSSAKPVEVRVPAGAYTYDPRRYLFDVKVPGFVGAGAVVVAYAMFYLGILGPLALVIGVVGLYTAFNTFLAHAYPRVVTLDDQTLALESFGRRDEFRIDEITQIAVRENIRYTSLYIRLNGGGISRGRYFIACKDMAGGDEARADALYRFFLCLEGRLHPDSMRVAARRDRGFYDE